MCTVVTIYHNTFYCSWSVFSPTLNLFIFLLHQIVRLNKIHTFEIDSIDLFITFRLLNDISSYFVFFFFSFFFVFRFFYTFTVTKLHLLFFSKLIIYHYVSNSDSKFENYLNNIIIE